MVEARIKVAITTILIESVLISPRWPPPLLLARLHHRPGEVGGSAAVVRGEAIGGAPADGGAAAVHALAGLDAARPVPADQRDALAKFVNIYTVHTFPVDVWLDAQGRVRRYQQTIDPSTIRLPAGVPSKDNPFTGPITTTYELYDFGSPVDVKIPPADQTTDLRTLLKNAGN